MQFLYYMGRFGHREEIPVEEKYRIPSAAFSRSPWQQFAVVKNSIPGRSEADWGALWGAWGRWLVQGKHRNYKEFIFIQLVRSYCSPDRNLWLDSISGRVRIRPAAVRKGLSLREASRNCAQLYLVFCIFLEPTRGLESLTWTD